MTPSVDGPREQIGPLYPRVWDSHCHIWWDRFDDDRDAVIERAREAGVDRMVVVGTTPGTSRMALDLAARHDGIFGTAGLHPHDVGSDGDEVRAELRALCSRDD